MRVVVLGAGIIGTCSAWHLLQAGHEVTLVDRQSDAALETSFANAAQISVGYSVPWAHPDTPLKALGWMLQNQAPLLLRPQWDRAQWSWLLRFLRQCTHGAFAHNLRQLVALLTTGLMFLTPIFYPASAVPAQYAWALALNPIAPVVENARQTLIFGHWPDWGALVLHVLVGYAIAWIGLVWFLKTKKGFADVT